LIWLAIAGNIASGHYAASHYAIRHAGSFFTLRHYISAITIGIFSLHAAAAAAMPPPPKVSFALAPLAGSFSLF